MKIIFVAFSLLIIQTGFGQDCDTRANAGFEASGIMAPVPGLK